MQNFQVGDKVTFVPDHAKNNINHSGCEIGTVTQVWEGAKAFDPQTVWVRFKGPTGESTPVKNLVIHPRNASNALQKGVQQIQNPIL